MEVTVPIIRFTYMDWHDKEKLRVRYFGVPKRFNRGEIILNTCIPLAPIERLPGLVDLRPLE